MNNTTFREHISFLSKYLHYTLTTEYASMYWDMLKHLADEQFKLACTNIVKDFVPTNTVPFPLVVHFLRYCGEAGENHAVASIARLKRAIRVVGQYESVTFNDPALHWAVNAFGGWESVCLWSDNDWNINEKRLTDTYKSASNNRVAEDGHLKGIHEKSNGFFRVYTINQNGKALPGPLNRSESIGFTETKQIDEQLNISHISDLINNSNQ